ncbi:hypothetical protein ABH14_14560 [Brevibacillus brevis]|nr:hypothetical protein [Brevibacillus brevis]
MILQLDEHEPSKSMRLIKKGAILFDSTKMNVHNNWKRAYNQSHNHDQISNKTQYGLVPRFSEAGEPIFWG